MKIGINGFGRIGKLTAWHHVGKKFFDEIVINIGREVGTCFEDIIHYLERDSTYGAIQNHLYGYQAKSIINNLNASKKTAIIDGIPITFLMKSRDPAKIDWKKHSVKIVVDTTGKFLDPNLSENHPKGSIRGHFKAGAEKVVISAPFKTKDNNSLHLPNDAITTVMGINSNDYNPKTHKIISNASCTTTCLAHMLKPLINAFGAKKILSASMATVHAATGSQQVLDRLPEVRKTDLRKNRSILSNIILTSTGAARTLSLVIPEMKKIGFIAESVRVPIASGSLIILVLNLQENSHSDHINRNTINDIYRERANIDDKKYLRYTDKQNVSGDVLSISAAGAIIEGHETHTRTAKINLDLSNILEEIKQFPPKFKANTNISVPVTQAVIYGWYDNEMNGYVNLLGDRTITIAKEM